MPIVFRVIVAAVFLTFAVRSFAEAAPSPPPATNAVQPFETRATQALLIDTDTETVLFQKAPDDRIAPASLAKLMTMAVVFEALKAGELHLDDSFSVSDNAWRKGGAPAGGTTMFAKPRSTIKVRDLMRGAIVQSANDACIVLAEGMAGSEEKFAERMNLEAAKLGLAHSHFTNATGRPDAEQYVTPRDLALLARHLIYDFPDYYAIYREPGFSWNGINQNNRNPLLNVSVGGDGLAVGGTAEAGFGLVGSAVRDGQRLIVVLTGLASDKERGDEARKIIDWGFHSFEKVTLFNPADVVAEATVFGGERPTVGLVSKAALDALLPRGGGDMIKARVVYRGPVKAPVLKGTPIGNLELTVADTVVRSAPLYAASDVAVGSLSQRAFDGLRELTLGWWR